MLILISQCMKGSGTNMEKLKDIKVQYDPEDVFGRLWPGYFKL